ncbi:MAG: precorrin-2 C(20)-methyltransferase [Geminicoccaceae bacterium]
MTRRGRLIGLGVGPGDPELMTVKGVRALEAAQAIAFIAAAGRASRSREIAAAYLRPGTRELIAVMPMTQDAEATGRAYSQLATGIVGELGQGHDVVFLCEGDPLLYGSFAHLLPRLGNRFECTVIPGITSITAAAAAAQMPLGLHDEPIALIPATAGPRRLAALLQQSDRAVVMKVGRHLEAVKQALAAAHMAEGAVLVENATQQGQRVRPLSAVTEAQVPYFSLILAGRSRRHA